MTDREVWTSVYAVALRAAVKIVLSESWASLRNYGKGNTPQEFATTLADEAVQYLVDKDIPE